MSTTNHAIYGLLYCLRVLSTCASSLVNCATYGVGTSRYPATGRAGVSTEYLLSRDPPGGRHPPGQPLEGDCYF